MNAEYSLLAFAKASIGVSDSWRKLGLPGEPKRSCRCPWREDRKPSFSISDDDRLWHDFALGIGGDVIDFIAHALSLDNSTACRVLLEWNGGSKKPSFSLNSNITESVISADRIKGKGESSDRRVRPLVPIKLPVVDTGCSDFWCRLAAQRSLGCVDGIKWLIDRELLRFGYIDGQQSWIVLDSSGYNAQARRLDGKPWDLPGNPKAKTLPGSRASWPIGLANLRSHSQIYVVEGGPDMLAAATLALRNSGDRDRTDFVCVTGASNRLHLESLQHFKSREVKIYAHNDEAGCRAAMRWREQIRSVHGICNIWKSTKPGEDLNDYVSRT